MVCGFWRHFLLGIVTVFVEFFLVLLQRILSGCWGNGSWCCYNVFWIQLVSRVSYLLSAGTGFSKSFLAFSQGSSRGWLVLVLFWQV